MGIYKPDIPSRYVRSVYYNMTGQAEILQEVDLTHFWLEIRRTGGSHPGCLSRSSILTKSGVVYQCPRCLGLRCRLGGLRGCLGAAVRVVGECVCGGTCEGGS